MTVAVMRGVDRWAGVPLCWLTALLLRTGRRASPERPPDPRAFVVLKMFGMGSVLLSMPVVALLRRKFPSARILYVTFAANEELLRELGDVDLPLIIRTHSPAAFLGSAVAVLRALRRERPAAVFDLEFFSKFATALAALSGAPVRAGFALPTRWRRWNITHAVPLDPGTHVTAAFLRQLAAIGVATAPEDPLPPPHLVPAPEAIVAVRRHTEDHPYICVNINAGSTSLERRWPPERFLSLVARLRAEDPALRFFFIGSADERAYVEAALAMRPELHPAVRNLAGSLNISELIALLAGARLLLTNDSGPMHLGAAAGTPVVALFGPESPALYGPLGAAVTITRSLPCSPCLSVYNAKLFRCPYDARCMKEITVDEAADAVRTVLAPVPAGTASP